MAMMMGEKVDMVGGGMPGNTGRSYGDTLKQYGYLQDRHAGNLTGVGSEQYIQQRVDELLPQAIVTSRGETDARLWNSRQASTTGGEGYYGIAARSTTVDVIPLELVLVPSQDRMNRFSHPSSHALPATTSLTGIKISSNMTEEDIYAMYAVHGIARTSYFYTYGGQVQSGFTIQVSGSFTTINNGPDTIDIADAVIWETQPLDARARKEYRANLPAIPGRDPEKMTPIVRAYHPQEIVNTMNPAIEFLFDAGVPHDQKNPSRIDDPDDFLTSTEDAALVLKNFVLSCGLSMVGRLAERGLITFNMPGGEDGDPNAIENYNEFDTALSTPLYEHYEKGLLFESEEAKKDEEVARELGTQLVDGNKSKFDVSQENIRNALLFLANKFGMTKPSVRNMHHQANPEFTEAVVGTALAGCMRDAVMYRAFSFARIMGKFPTATGGIGVTRAHGETLRTTQSLSSSVLASPKRFLTSMTQVVYTLNKRIVGTALGHSTPGTSLDLLR